MEITNKKEFVALRKFYQTLTIVKLKEELAKTSWAVENIAAFGANLMSVISGFGSPGRCSLCEFITSSAGMCTGCVYRSLDKEAPFFPCAHTHKSYKDIYNAKDIKELRKALGIRIKYMLSIEKSWKTEKS